VDELVQELTGEGLEAYLQAHRASTEGEHTAVIATVINLLHGSLWRACGQEPAVAVGHSVGEVAAAHSAGLLTVREALTAARALGRVAATQAGGMLFTVVDDIKAIPADDGLFMSGLSYANQRGARVSVSGPVAALDKWLASDKQAVRIPSAHPWHHPLYANTPTEALPATSGPSSDRSCVFVSAAGGGRAFKPEDCLDEQHWRTWLTEPNSLDAALRAAKGLAPSGTAVVIECGAHPVARGAAQVNLQPLVHVASMHRDVPAFTQLQESRAALQAATGSFASQLRTSMAARCQDLQCTWTATFANQGPALLLLYLAISLFPTSLISHT
jgi:acyl transferase domain-containing protein